MFKSIKKVWKEFKFGMREAKYKKFMDNAGVTDYKVVDIVEGVDVIQTSALNGHFAMYHTIIDCIIISADFFESFSKIEYDAIVQHELGHRNLHHPISAGLTLEGTIRIELEADKYAIDKGHGEVLHIALMKILQSMGATDTDLAQARFKQFKDLGC